GKRKHLYSRTVKNKVKPKKLTFRSRSDHGTQQLSYPNKKPTVRTDKNRFRNKKVDSFGKQYQVQQYYQKHQKTNRITGYTAVTKQPYSIVAETAQCTCGAIQIGLQKIVERGTI